MKSSRRLIAVLMTAAVALVATATANAQLTATLFGATGSGSMPRGLAIDSNGNIYTANQNNTISKVTPAGVVETSWATSVVSSTSSIAVGPDGAVYASNSSDSKVQKFSSSGGAPAAEPPTIANPSDPPLQPQMMTVDTAGNIYFVSAVASPKTLGKITSGGVLSSPTTFSYQPGGLITDSAGNVYISDQTADTVRKYNSSLTEVTSGGWPATVGDMPGKMAVDSTYLYVAYEGGSSGAGVSRVKLSDATATAAWASGLSGFSASLTAITVAPNGTVYVAATAGMFRIYAITASGTSSTLTVASFQPLGLVVDANGNVYTASFGMGGPSAVAGVYKIASGTTPTPTPTPSSNSSSTTTTPTTTGAPAPGPALKVSDIPAEITLDLGSSTGGAADQPITAEVPCTAPEGQLLDRCTVNVTAPQYVLLGQGDGINVRADKKVSIGKATVKAKSGRKTIIVKVKINQRGRTALKRNLKITATVGLTAITVANLKSTGDAETTMRLPTQLISPASGIFDSGSTTLNKAGVAFVNRLAALLPKAPKSMVFIGFTDITGVPGDNRWIADRRAKAVRDALEAKGIDPAKSSIEVKAARSPRDDNATEQGRERNRRVSIRITY